MKSFLKLTLASILGIFISFFLLLFLLAAVISTASSEKETVIKSHTVLLAKFNFPIVDRSSDNPFENFSPGKLTVDTNLGLNIILDNIEKASKDANIDGIFLDLTGFPIGPATLQEIRNALEDFKNSGKFIYAHADFFTQGSYLLASVADKIYLTPEGELPWKGLSSQQIFFKRALDRLGIDPHVIRHGNYKSAAEPLMMDRLSDENRRQISDYINSLWFSMLEKISEARGIPVETLQKYADDLTILNAESLYKNKFVDSLLYFDQVLNELKNLTGTKEKDNLNSIDIKKYTRVPKKSESKGLEKNKIAVIYASGNIVTGEGEVNTMGSDKISRVIREARRDSSIKAIVLRVNSGGGSSLASEVIWREVKLASETKPLIASLGDVAASGGYYIVSPAKKIIASPNSLTGSIGVFGLMLNGADFMNKKLGITSEVVKTNKYSDFGNFFRSPDPAETIVIQKEVDHIYDTFISHVSEDRGMSKEEVDRIGGGRIYSGRDAMKIGLIDEFGGLKKAIEIAAKEAGLETYRIVELPKKLAPFEAIMKQVSGEIKHRALRSELGENYFYFEQMKKIQEMEGIQSILPFEIRVD